MKLMQFNPFLYVLAFFTSLCIMVIVDYLLGNEAEHLNAWAILSRIFGYDSGIQDSLAIRKFSLLGATIIMILVNFVFGSLLLHGLHWIIKFFNS